MRSIPTRAAARCSFVYACRAWLVPVLVAASIAIASPAAAEPVACKREIARAGAKFAQAKIRALQKCEDAVVSGKHSGPCPDAKASGKIAQTASKLRSAIAKRCGGSDATCNGSGDDTLASIGWNVGSCQNIASGNCSNAITTCDDVATCVLCVNEAAIDQDIALYYDALTSGPDATVKKCQRTLGKEAVKFFAAARKALSKCEDGVLRGTSGGPCPDGTAQAAIDKAEAKKVAKICNACGGPDNACGGPDDLTRAQIGFDGSCPAVDPPGGTPPCGGAVDDLADIVTCVDCVTEFGVRCVSAAGAPAAGPYPGECNGGAPVPTPTPTPTPPPADPTPTVTTTPDTCGNGTVEGGEDCDGSDDAGCPGLCRSDCTCAPPCTLPNPLPASIALVARPGIDLDTGWTGVSHDLPGIDDGPTASARLASCNTDLGSPTCGQCDVSGPIAYPGPTTNCRCFAVDASDGSSFAMCDPEAPSCTGGETCECFYGPPLPLSSGGVPVCVVNRFDGTFTGTVNIANSGLHAGEGASLVRLMSAVHNGIGATNPCPQCQGDPTARDGLAQGTCAGGPRNGLACDAAGTNPFFGSTAFECPPPVGARIGDLPIRFDQATTGTATLSTNRPCTATAGNCFCDTCPTPQGEACNSNADCPGGLPCGGKRCIGGADNGTPCATNGQCANNICNRPGTPTQQNACIGGVCDPDPDGYPGSHEGVCSNGPLTSRCHREPFRGCSETVDCNPPPAGNCPDCLPDQFCAGALRECFLDPIIRTGTPGTRDSIIAATFCLRQTRSDSVNNVAGLPGPGAVLQPTRTFRIGPLCGNGAVDAGEQCDGIADAACPDACGIDCRCPAAASCGDGEVNGPTEECDGAADGACPGVCQGDCTCGPFCGDGAVNQPSETCDDGNDDDGDGCDTNCTASGCGNGIQAGAEQCDGSDDDACGGATCQPDCTCNPFCGDGVRNQPSESCDGGDQGVCAGTCTLACACAAFCGNDVREGAESCDGSDSAACPGACGGDCTCPKMGELTLSTLPGADLDTGWTGTSHNFSIQTCATIAGDLGGCNPSLGDNECTFLANVGSFCSGDPSRSCTDNTACVGAGSCIVNPYGAPLPLSSGGVPVCILNRFSGDVTGTYDLQTGGASLTVPLNALVTLAADANVPCPTCDCASPPCQCGDTGTCSNNPLTSCTVGGVGPFGPTSNDCQPTGPNVSGGGLNIAFAPATTGVSTFPSSTPCTGSGFTQYGCWIAGQTQPSACIKGCNGGSNADQECTVDADCPGGIGPNPCRPLCRQDPSGEVGEGRCLLGPVDRTCAAAHQVSCQQDSDCIGGVGPCVAEVRRCFMDPIVRVGAPGTSTLTLASTFPIPATSSPAVNNTAGLPGPGAIRYPQTLALAYCGDGALNQESEECDGAADANCPGQCNDAACICNVVCGNNAVDFGEQCDGSGLPQCGAGQTCSAPGNPDQCTCTPAICGDGYKAAAEQCDPGGPGGTPSADDAACPGECQTALCTCPAAVCGDGVIEGAEVCELPGVGCGALQACVGCAACLP